jgi:hypothetical protein
MARNAKCVASALVLGLGLLRGAAAALYPQLHGKRVLPDLHCTSHTISVEGSPPASFQVAAALCARPEAPAGVIRPEVPDLTYGQASSSQHVCGSPTS